MKRSALSSAIIIAAALWAIAAIALGVLLLTDYELPFDFYKPSETTSLPDKITPKARIDVIDAGQGSSLSVKIYGNNTKSILVDAGEEGESDSVLRALRSADISSLDLMVITHPHTDHFGGAIEILQRLPVSEVWMPDVSLELTPTNSTYQKFLEALEKSGCRVLIKSVAETVKLSDDASLSSLDGFVDAPKDLNDASLCLRIDIGETSFLITGDGETAVENTLLQNDSAVDADILIAGHHGSGTSSGHRFLNAVSPAASVISVGQDNDYGHPDDDVYARLASFGNVYRTDINGTVTFFTDGDQTAISAKNISDLLDTGR